MFSESSFSFADGLSKLAVLLISYFAPVKEIVHVMLIFILIDFISGVWAARKRKETLESRKFRKTLTKFLWYTVALILSFMMEKTFNLSWSNLSGIIGGFICFIELKSIFENITVITGEPIFMKILHIIRKRGSDTMGDLSDRESQDDHSTSKTDPDGSH
ncbi:MAG: holin [Bacteroidetes bacterium]|nr:MAG: holin [Bacteroidota bacterium]